MTSERLAVNDIYPCVQGEGVQTGVAMVLLRLHGCGVGCPWCDTKETWDRTPSTYVPTLDEALGATPAWTLMDPGALAAWIAERWPTLRWVLLTGGEPANQDLAPLVAALHTHGYAVALETSGTATGHVGAGCDWVCVSPKIDMPGGFTLQPEAFRAAREVKMVIGKQADLDRFDALLAALRAGQHLTDDVTICLQPVSQSERATALCLQTVMERGWRLSVQMHKYLAQR